MKTCSRCGETKEVILFPRKKENKDGRHSHCKTCRAQYNKARYDPKKRSELYQTNLDEERKNRREYYQQNKINYYANNYRDWETDRKSTRLNSSHSRASRMPSSA